MTCLIFSFQIYTNPVTNHYFSTMVNSPYLLCKDFSHRWCCSWYQWVSTTLNFMRDVRVAVLFTDKKLFYSTWSMRGVEIAIPNIPNFNMELVASCNKPCIVHASNSVCHDYLKLTRQLGSCLVQTLTHPIFFVVLNES